MDDQPNGADAGTACSRGKASQGPLRLPRHTRWRVKHLAPSIFTRSKHIGRGRPVNPPQSARSGIVRGVPRPSSPNPPTDQHSSQTLQASQLLLRSLQRGFTPDPHPSESEACWARWLCERRSAFLTEVSVSPPGEKEVSHVDPSVTGCGLVLVVTCLSRRR
jgi:hypothetical protein